MNGVSVAEKTIEDIFVGENGYVVPLYQREYAWTDHEVGRLLADIWESYRKDPKRNYYIGTLVVKPEEATNDFQVIDGQQRLTTLSILYSLIGDGAKSPVLRFANREHANVTLRRLYKLRGDVSRFSDEERKNSPVAMLAAVWRIKSFCPALDDGGLSSRTMLEMIQDAREGSALREYVLKKVKVFLVNMQDVDAMSYFEVMNNRGEQLKYHELLKEKMVAGLREFAGKDDVGGKHYDELAEIFDSIWTACSYVDGNLLDHMHACFELKDSGKHWWELGVEKVRLRDREDEKAPPWERNSVIRDFSNFLMHVLRLYVKRHGLDVVVPLDERRMQDKFEDPAVELNSVEFLDLLVKTRLDFDKYVVKVKMVNDEVEKWRLKEVVVYGSGRNRSYDAKNTYQDQAKLQQMICLQSALQVSNAEQRYKEWVYAILSASDEERANPDLMVGILEGLARERLVAARKSLAEDGYDIFACGLRTPRLFLNMIDYLLWREQPQDFVFKYYNSIEHHHPQHQDKESEQWVQNENKNEIDEVGNLYLTSSSDNSSMSNNPAVGKVALYRNSHDRVLPDYPKRRYMYVLTEQVDGWTKQKMKSLTNRVKELMRDFGLESALDELQGESKCP